MLKNDLYLQFQDQLASGDTMQFPQIKTNDFSVTDRLEQLKGDVGQLKDQILNHAPTGYKRRYLDTVRIRIFKFPQTEDCNEYFVTVGKKKYVCLNSTLLKRRYHAAVQYLLHGIAHSFCYLRDGIAEEVFCEFVSYSILKELLRLKGEKFNRRVLKSIMNTSPKSYNSYFRVGRKLAEKNEKLLLKLNEKARKRRISKKKEERIAHKLLKSKKIVSSSSDDDNIPELERGFKIVR